MDHANHLAVWLYSVALVLEVAALVCVVIDVIKSRRRSAVFVEQARRRTVNLRGFAARGRASGSAGLVGGRTPTLDERVTILERKMDALRESTADMISKALARAIGEAEAAAEDVRTTAEERLQLLVDATDATGKRWLATVGAVLLFAGIVVGFLGNLAGSNAL